MELFVYNWFYNGYTVYGHCLDSDYNYTLLKVLDFYPSCYVEGETVPSSATMPFEVEYKRMLSSRDISTLKPFYRLFFRNAKDLTSFSYEQRNCYMADIPQIATFLSRIKADYVGWVQVPLQYTRDVSVSMRNIDSVPEKIPLPSPRVMSFDIEVRSMDSGMPQPHRILDTVEMISVIMFGGNKPQKTYIMHTLDKPLDIDAVDIVCEDEIKLITGFFDLIIQEDPTVVTGYNIYGFDIHYLVSRLKLRLVEIPGVSKGTKNAVDLIKVDWTSDAYGHNSYDRLVIGGRVIIDMYLYFKRMKLDKYSLDFVSEKFLGDRKNDMPHATMAGAFMSGDRDALREVAKYCIQDSVLVMRLFDKVKMWIDVCEVSKITRCGIEDIYTRGEQMKMVSQCVAECTKRNIVLQPQYPSEWKQYEGAYVLEPVKGVYDGCSVLDFQSLYPSIIIAYNICPSTYTKSKMDSVAIETTDHRFRKQPVGLLPGMIKRILDERKAVKAQMADIGDNTSVEYIVLDRRQNALKICANSVYGMMGFKNSRYFGHLGCAESVTTVGRILLNEIVDRIEMAYPVQVIYGDSVTGYTPTIVRVQSKFVFIETFENLATKWGGSEWVESDGKESCELYGVEAWTDYGWTRIHRVIRHTLATHKRIVRVLTHTGLVDVTDEHSLLNASGEPIDAGSVKVGDELLHHPYPVLHETETRISPDEAEIFGMFCGDGSCGTYNCPSGKKTTWAINNADLLLLLKYKRLCEKVYYDHTWVITFAPCFHAYQRKGSAKSCSAANTHASCGVYKLSPRGDIVALSQLYRSLMYRQTEKTVPQEILNSCLGVRQAFWNGLYDADGDKGGMRIDQKHQVTIASFALLASSIGYNISITSPDTPVAFARTSERRSKGTREDKENVFRLTLTKALQRKNPIAVKKVHTVSYAGYVYDVTTSNHHFQAGPGKMIVHNTDSCMLWHRDKTTPESVLLAKSICNDVTVSLPEPMALKFETYCDKVILLTKKRYILVAGDNITYKGVMNARRDYCKFAKDIYGSTMEMVAKGKTTEEVKSYIDERIMLLLCGKVKTSDLVVTKSLARKLSTYKVNQPHVVLARRLVQKTGMDVPAGTRLEYIYVDDPDIPMVTPEEFEEGGHKADGMFYVSKQLATQVDDVLSAIGMGSYIKESWLQNIPKGRRR